MSERSFSGVCDTCREPVLTHAVKALVKHRRRAGLSTAADDIKGDDKAMLIIKEVMSRQFLIRAHNGEMHPECVMACVQDPAFFWTGQPEGAQLFATNLALLHAVCSAHPRIRNMIFEAILSVSKMSVDVYRYIQQNSADILDDEVKRQTMIDAVRADNLELANYVIDGIQLHDDEIVSETVEELLSSENGVRGLEMLGSRRDIKNEVVDAINFAAGDDNYDDDTSAVIQTNVRELLDKNYICSSEICYKI
jgi:hypothetical protein